MQGVLARRFVGGGELLVPQIHDSPRPDGLQQGSQMFGACRVRGAFKLNKLVHASRVEVRGHRQAVCNFAQRLIELLKDGDVAKLNQGLGGETNGIQVVVVQLHIVDGKQKGQEEGFAAEAAAAAVQSSMSSRYMRAQSERTLNASLSRK